jgi:hypothetical protein
VCSGEEGCAAAFTTENAGAFKSTLPWSRQLGLSGTTFTDLINGAAMNVVEKGSCLLTEVQFTEPANSWIMNLENNGAPVSGAEAACTGTVAHTLTEKFGGVKMKTSVGEGEIAGTFQVWRVPSPVEKRAQVCTAIGVLNTTL